MSYPKSMQFAVSRLSGYSKQNVKLRPMSQASANPGDVIIFEMPANSIVDFRTFNIFGKGNTGGTLLTGGSNASCVFPKHIEAALIDSIQVEINGTLVDTGFLQYGSLFKLYMDYLSGVDRNSTSRCLLQQGDLSVLGHTTGNLGSSSVVVNKTENNTQFCLNSFLGFLSAKCPIIDTSILGQVRVLLRLQGTNPLLIGGTTNPTGFSYSLSGLFATIDVISMNDGVYYDMIQQRLAQAPLEIMFDRHYIFQNGQTGSAQTTRWAVSTQSLDWVIGTHFHNDSRNSNANLIDPVANTSRFYRRDGSEVKESYFQFNNVQYPNYLCDNDEGTVLGSTLQNLNVLPDLVGGCDPAMNTLPRWRGSFYAHVHRFNHLPSGDDDNRLISGLNTMGTNAQGTYTTTGTVGSSNLYYPTVFAKTTSTLAIGPNRTFEIRQ
jgi:hypothetical protein